MLEYAKRGAHISGTAGTGSGTNSSSSVSSGEDAGGSQLWCLCGVCVWVCVEQPGPISWFLSCAILKMPAVTRVAAGINAVFALP